MKVTALGHAGLRIEAHGTSILVDPWFDPQGAFDAAWFPFPDNSHLEAEARLGVEAVIVTHEHQYHFDVGVLRGVPSSVPIVRPH
jgi:UDP-MurNAc hydroxylase